MDKFFIKKDFTVRELYIGYIALLFLYICALYLFSSSDKNFINNIYCILFLEALFTFALALTFKKESFFVYLFFLIFFSINTINYTDTLTSPTPWMMILLFIPRAYKTFALRGNNNICQLNLFAFISIIILLGISKNDSMGLVLTVVFAYLLTNLFLTHIFITKNLGIKNLISFIDNAEKNRMTKAKKEAKLNPKTLTTRCAFMQGFDYLDVLFYLAFAFMFLKYWVMPEPKDIDTIYYLCILMGFEFIMVHSGVFMSVMKTSWSILFFFPAYGLFALCFTAMVGDMSIVWLYLLVVFNRMRFAFFAKDEQTKIQNGQFSVIAVLTYFILLFICVFSSSLIPEFGLNKDFLISSNYDSVVSIGGLLTEVPNMSMCFGFLYYGFLALWEFLIIRARNKREGKIVVN